MSRARIGALDLAYELKRLTNNVIKDMRVDSDLACISSLTAIRPLVQLILETVTGDIDITKNVEDDIEDPKFPIGFCTSVSTGSAGK